MWQGIVTRCPLVLRMKSHVRMEGQWTGHIEYVDAEKHHVSQDIGNPEEVSRYVDEGKYLPKEFQNVNLGCI